MSEKGGKKLNDLGECSKPDLHKYCGEGNVHEGVGWIAGVLVRSNETAEKSMIRT